MLGLGVGIAGAIGAMARFWIDGLIRRRREETLPVDTLVINVTGSLLLGVLTGLTLYHGLAADTKTVLGTGFCGGYTTFSSFSLQTLNLMNDGEWLGAGGNILFSVALCLLAVWAGHMIASNLNALKWT